MSDTWRERRAARRVKAGDGRPLKRFRWWQQLTRSLFHLRIAGAAGQPIVYSIDVRHGGDSDDGEVRARLYRDGVQEAVSKTPARFPVPGGVIEVATTSFGLKRAHFVGEDGREHQLRPDPRTAAAWRARLDRTHPGLSRMIGAVSVVFLLIGVALLGLQLLEIITGIPPIAERVGVFISPVQLPLWLNVALTFGAAVASTERALRLRYHWLLDAAGN
ncbi:hypothetical protein [Agrococcus sp. ARC_14]|uniref:hypothetical protein n=1 Tax=Agrococcus sp. ARC_14 TaxID=2919927 RepID=UPI001F06D1A6|nr:hypothetical protein [Agrococcus sp. ARC_14]MCH1881748.1 hypothetical protein [Agrococcus sp. ARC_14]